MRPNYKQAKPSYFGGINYCSKNCYADRLSFIFRHIVNILMAMPELY